MLGIAFPFLLVQVAKGMGELCLKHLSLPVGVIEGAGGVSAKLKIFAFQDFPLKEKGLKEITLDNVCHSFVVEVQPVAGVREIGFTEGGVYPGEEIILAVSGGGFHDPRDRDDGGEAEKDGSQVPPRVAPGGKPFEGEGHVKVL